MKLVIGGSTGFVATEILTQAIKNPAISSIVALGRRAAIIPTESGSNPGKLKSVICDNFEDYPDNVMAELEDADACIWTIAITPSKLSTVPGTKPARYRETTRRQQSRPSTISAQHKQPLRFLYISGHFAPRSRAEIPPALLHHGLVEYGLLRGEAESLILEYAEHTSGRVQSCVVKPGLVDALGAEKLEIPGVPHVDLPDVAAAMLEQVVGGFEKDTLSNDDLVRIGRQVLEG